jgi:amidase
VTSIHQLSAAEQARKIRRREISPVEVIDHYLDRIGEIDPQLNAYVTVAAEQARAAALDSESALLAGPADELSPLYGVAVSVKDNTDVAGVPTTCSSKLFADFVPDVDAPVVARMRAAGMVVIGKTNVPEFDTSFTDSELNGPCRNPWDLERSPAGSSGGAASAMAARLCSVAHGSDGAGSVRVPASFCGLVGFKASRSRAAPGPDTPFDTSAGTAAQGPLSYDVEDVAHLLDVMIGVYSNEYWVSKPPIPFGEVIAERPSTLRIATCVAAPMDVAVDEPCVAAVEQTADILASLGHRIDRDRGPDWDAALRAGAALHSPALATRVDLEDVGRVEQTNQMLVKMGWGLGAASMLRAVEDSNRLQHEFIGFWDEIDVLITPTCGMVPPRLDYAPWTLTPEEHMRRLFFDFPNFASPFNATGQPAITLPVGWTSSGLPVGVQLVAARGRDDLVLCLAAALQAECGWQHRSPAIATTSDD